MQIELHLLLFLYIQSEQTDKFKNWIINIIKNYMLFTRIWSPLSFLTETPKRIGKLKFFKHYPNWYLYKMTINVYSKSWECEWKSGRRYFELFGKVQQTNKCSSKYFRILIQINLIKNNIIFQCTKYYFETSRGPVASSSML